MAFAATTAWDVRTTGSDANGGGFNTASSGTDYSQQNSAQVAYTDLVINATTNTQCTSAANPFTAAHVGNIINITGGTGFTVQRVQVVSVAGAVATCDKSLGTLSSTGGTGNLGGALLTISVPFPLAVSGNTIHAKNGTYTITSTLTIGVATLTVQGFNTTHGDGGTKPVITCATNSIDLFTQTSLGGIVNLDNLALTHTAGTRGYGILKTVTHDTTGVLVVSNCTMNGCLNGINGDNGGSRFDWVAVWVINTSITNCTSHGIALNSSVANLVVKYSRIYNSTGFGITGVLSLNMSSSVVDTSLGGAAINLSNGTITTTISLDHSALVFTTGSGIFGSSTGGPIILNNCIIFGNSSWGVDGRATQQTLTAGALIGKNNAYGSNTSGNRTSFNASPGDFAITVDPFTNHAAGDYSLNSTAGGGAALKAAGFPGISVLGTGFVDVGPLQTAGGSSGMLFIPDLSGT